MVKTIIIFVIAALFFVVAGVFRQSLKKEQLAEKEYTEGVVTRKIYSGSGNARFLCFDGLWRHEGRIPDGILLRGGRSISTRVTMSGYFITRRNTILCMWVWMAQAAIPCSASVPRTCNFFRLVGCIIAVLGIYSIFQV